MTGEGRFVSGEGEKIETNVVMNLFSGFPLPLNLYSRG